MRQLLIIPFLILLQINVFSQNTIHISNTQDLVKVGKDVLFLEDVAGDLSFEDILKEENQIKFKKNNHDVFSRPAMKSAFWFKFIIQNQSQESIWLEIGDTFSCWNLDFYAPDRNNQYPEPLLLGSLRPQKNKQFPSKYYCVELTKGKQTNAKVYYLKTYGSSKVQGNLTKTHVFRVGGVKALAKQAMTYDYMQSFFIGLMITMIITSLFILFSTREKTYLLYVFYLVNVLIVVSFVTSAPLFYHRWFWEYNYVWMSAFYFSVSLFTIHTLNLKHDAPNLNRWIWVLTIVLCIIIPLLNLFNLVNFILLTNTFQVTVGVYYFTLFYCGVSVWRKGNKGARFYTLAAFILIISVFVFLFAINNILPFNLFTYRILYIGFSLEALLFGWAIGDKYNEIQKDKEKIQLKNIVLVKEQKQVLEKTVEERTHELQSSNEELQVMNEELSQTQEELQTQRDFLDDQNITLQSQNKQIQDSIRAAELIQKSILPYQSKLENLLQDYFILNRPKDVVSGDFYWVHEHNDEIILVVADCTGHGVPGAFMTLIGSSLLDKIVETWQITSPNLILKKLDEEIKARLYQENAVYNLGGMDAVVINFKKESIQTTITFSGAKNNLLYFHSKDKEFHEVKATRKSIGAKDNNTKKFENTIINLPTGSTLYLGTDGLQDQNNTKRKRFGSLRLKQTFEAYSNLPLDEQKTKIEATLDEYMKGTSQRDDILWLGLRV